MVADDGLNDRFQKLRRSLQAIQEVTEPPKNTLRILGSARSEQYWNTLLAYFLDPTQPHGFDADLLKAFLDTAEEKTDLDIGYYHRDIEEVVVETEVSSPQDIRPDIVIRVPDEWFVCIECKVESTEGREQTYRYVEDTHLGGEEKDEYPEDGQHYLFLSKENAPNANASEFENLSWSDVVDTFSRQLHLSHGRYPERSVSQLNDFLSTVIRVTRMEDDDFTETQKEKVRILSEYREDIDELIEAADSLRQRSIEEWEEMFHSQLDDDLWTDRWHTRDGKWGIIYRDGWYLDDDLNPTLDVDDTRGGEGARFHFQHLIRKKSSFREGKLTYILCCNTSVEVRDEFHRLYNSDRWQTELGPVLEEHGIANKGNKSEYTRKTYEVDQAELPESYFRTLNTAFEEHIPLAEVVDEIIEEARREV